ncbi:hypothetical protein [Burkholderia sp. BDU5]|uniref:hypothetical protein n=1 Tax=Burkholderia sp. BDU5 TaxID=1385590 RepID=UPI0012E37188|nr:hypothetical protein [Burkholderia sp. BDU5]
MESETGQPLGAATLLDAVANSRRRRSKPSAEPATAPAAAGPNLIELTQQHHYQLEV